MTAGEASEGIWEGHMGTEKTRNVTPEGLVEKESEGEAEK